MNKKVTQLEKEINLKDDSIQKLEMKMEAKDVDLERHISIMRNPPYTFFCSYQHRSNVTLKYITYSDLLYSSTNVEGADMDLSNGVFTAGWGGSYTVTWSLLAREKSGAQDLWIYLKKNG